MRRYAAALLFVMAASSDVPAARPDSLAAARQAYNAGDYDAAITAARLATEDPRSAAEAAVVLGRALVERYRRTAESQDLADARAALLEAGGAELTPAVRVEWLLGSAETLYFEDQFGAAAALFGSLLDEPRVATLLPGGRERLLDWWATACDRAAQQRTGDARRADYQRLSTRVLDELQRDPSLGPAAYWRVVAARGAGDLEGAWDAAMAAWVRAPQTGDRGAQLRADLDRIVTQALIPERARRSGREEEKELTALRSAWEDFKARWTSR